VSSSQSELPRKRENECAFKFSQNVEKTFTETYDMIKTVFGEDSMSCTQDFEWFTVLKKGEHLWKVTPRSKQDKSVACSFLRSRRYCALRVHCRG
jgi:hypothetical protein